jgi:cytochrome c biogenesis protein CcdA/thiol-disulfide isomerase/thioredoxin
MTLFILAYLAGVLTIATPCILPILPFVFARADRSFREGGAPMLLGLAFAFTIVASLAAVTGSWAVDANRYGRAAALMVMAAFGAAMLWPALGERLMAPLVRFGSHLSGAAEKRSPSAGVVLSVVLGVATGFLWAPCAGPVLGLILAAAALQGSGLLTTALLLAYALGAASSLAVGLALGRHALSKTNIIRWSEGLRRIAGAAVVLGVAAIALNLDAGVLKRWSADITTSAEQSLVSAFAPDDSWRFAASTPAGLSGPLLSIVGGQPWINTPPLGEDALKGKVVLVNFWTYSCINCLRALPHVRAWAEKYRDSGLVVVGVHTPEFAFEKNFDNVSKAAAALGVRYPVVLDNDFRIWRRFGNQGWPGLHVIDADSRVRRSIVGEGDYDDTEKLIRTLLAERGQAAPGGPATVMAPGAQAEADPSNLRSPESYVGYEQARNFASPDVTRPDAPQLYRPAATLPLNHWDLGGRWTVGGEFAAANDAGGAIRTRFHARDLHLVLGPSADGSPIRFRVTIDGAAPGPDHGADVDEQGWGTARDVRLHQLVRQTGAIRDRTFRIEFSDPGARAYAFTFG